MSQSKVKNNVSALEDYIKSMKSAIDKAKRGSECEDGYFLEKLDKMAHRMGMTITPIK